MEVIVAGGDGRCNPLVVHLAGAVDVFAQAIIKIAIVAALSPFRFAVEFDFRNQQTGEAARIVVQSTLFFANFDREFRLGDAIAPRASQWRGTLRRETRRCWGGS